jgi:hypothetical protein
MEMSSEQQSGGRLFVLHNLVEENGKTIRGNNLERPHNIPVGTLVEIKFDDWFGEGACWKVHARLWVVAHRRDCDGTPLYSVSQWRDPDFAMRVGNAFHGYSEESLTVVEATDALARGEGALEWEGEGE